MNPRAGLEGEAIAHFQAGRLAQARKAFTALVEADPANVNALHALGVIALQAQRFEEAAAFLARAAAIDAGSFPIAYNFATALRQAGQVAEALPAFERAVALNPRSAEAYLGLGNTQRALGEREAARESFTLALRANPALTGAQYNLALVEFEAGELAAAAASLARVVEREPAHFEGWNHLGLLAHREGNLEAALGFYRRALAANPAFAPALTNWGNALKDRGDLAGAEERYTQALAANPAEAAALVNRASVAAERGDRAAARAANRRALEVRPDYPEALYALGLIDLAEHAFEPGWAGYERRFDTDPPAAVIAPPHRPRLASADFAGVTRLAVRREQGLGDQILFSTLLPELEGRGIEVVVELDARLAGAYRRRFPAFEFQAPAAMLAAIGRCDHEVPIGSLPRLFRKTAASFDQQPSALLQPDAERVAQIRRALGAGRYVAISWRSFQGFGRRHIGERKSIALERFAALDRGGRKLLDVQYGDVDEERAAFDERHPGLRVAVPGLDTRNDLEGVLAAIAASDHVITASNVTAHFAGALGKRTWLVYLGANPPFHYWAPRSDGRSPWYPSVEILTHPAWTGWEAAFDAIAMRLERE